MDLRGKKPGQMVDVEEFTVQSLAVKSSQQMIKENLQKKLDEEKKEFLNMTIEEQNEEVRKNMPFADMAKAWKESMNETYPGTMGVFIGAKPNGDNSSMVFEYYGNIKNIGSVLGTLMDSCHDAVDLVNQAMAGFSKHCRPEEAEQCITALQDIIKNFRQQQSQEVIITRLKQEIKRLNKSCRFDLVKIKQQELKDYTEKVERDKRTRENRIASLVKARETKAEKKRKREQLERERNRQQPNFAKQAKKKMQKIKERQAAKKQKTASEGAEIKSCSMFNNVG